MRGINILHMRRSPVCTDGMSKAGCEDIDLKRLDNKIIFKSRIELIVLLTVFHHGRPTPNILILLPPPRPPPPPCTRRHELRPTHTHPSKSNPPRSRRPRHPRTSTHRKRKDRCLLSPSRSEGPCCKGCVCGFTFWSFCCFDELIFWWWW